MFVMILSKEYAVRLPLTLWKRFSSLIILRNLDLYTVEEVHVPKQISAAGRTLKGRSSLAGLRGWYWDAAVPVLLGMPLAPQRPVVEPMTFFAIVSVRTSCNRISYVVAPVPYTKDPATPTTLPVAFTLILDSPTSSIRMAYCAFKPLSKENGASNQFESGVPSPLLSTTLLDVVALPNIVFLPGPSHSSVYAS